jgi:dihydrofolate reductase
VDWNSASLAHRELEEEVSALRQQEGKDIFVGSRSLIVQLLNLQLIDELQLCIHPVAQGKGLPLFKDLEERIVFKLKGQKTIQNGAMILYYQPQRP